MRSSYNVVGQINHLANCNYEAVTEVYFFFKRYFLKRSTILKPSHNAPKHMKKKGTMLAANTSMVMLSITFGQLQFYPCIEVIKETLHAISAFHVVKLTTLFEVVVHVQGIVHINLVHNGLHSYLAKLQSLLLTAFNEGEGLNGRIHLLYNPVFDPLNLTVCR